MRKNVAVILMLCLCSGAILTAQDAAEPETVAVGTVTAPVEQARFTPYKSNFLKDEGKMWSAPFRMDATGFLVGAAVLAATGVLIANDEGIYERFKSFQGENPWVDKVSPVVTLLGDWGVDCGVAGLFFVGGALAKDRRARDTGVMAWEALVHTGFLVQIVKHVAGRQRPSVDAGNDSWHGPAGFFKRYNEGCFSKYDSFFSGHTVSAWSLATVIAGNYRDRFWVPPLCYGVATLVGLSRLTEDAHWFSDVFLGAVVGYAVGRMVVRSQNKCLTVIPALAPAGAGLTFIYEIR